MHFWLEKKKENQQEQHFQKYIHPNENAKKKKKTTWKWTQVHQPSENTFINCYVKYVKNNIKSMHTER